MQRCLPSPPPPPHPPLPPLPRSYLPRLSLLWAGARASVPLKRQRSLSLLVLGSVGGGRHLPVHPVSVLCLLLAPSLLGRQALSLTRVRCSFSGGPVGKHKSADFVKQTNKKKGKSKSIWQHDETSFSPKSTAKYFAKIFYQSLGAKSCNLNKNINFVQKATWHYGCDNGVVGGNIKGSISH